MMDSSEGHAFRHAISMRRMRARLAIGSIAKTESLVFQGPVKDLVFENDVESVEGSRVA